VATAALLVATGATTVVARTIRVSATGTSCPRVEFTRIQNALDIALPGDRIVVCPGIYDEQIVIRTPVRLSGKRGAILRPSVMGPNATSLRTGDAIAAVVAVTVPSRIRRLDIDASNNGLACDGSAPRLVGVFFWGASGTLRQSRVSGTRLGDAELSCDTGAAVFVQSNGSDAITVSITNNIIFDYQRAGIVVNESGARARIRRNTISGLGPTPQVPQSGIQVGFGASALVMKNLVQNNTTPTTDSCVYDAGNLVFEADNGIISGNVFRGNTAGVYVVGSRNRVLRNRIEGFSLGVPTALDGILVVGDDNKMQRNQIHNMSAAGIRLYGSRNRVRNNAIVGTRAAHLCAALQDTPGCADVLPVCGVGLLVAEGSGNTLVNNTLVGNDINILDQGLTTRRGPSR
jgi:parallel beta-helix repeat protein